MNTKDTLDGRTLGEKDLRVEQAAADMQRTGRAVKAVRWIAEHASANGPSHMRSWKETGAVYRLRGSKTMS
jgi:hypothetical protein